MDKLIAIVLAAAALGARAADEAPVSAAPPAPAQAGEGAALLRRLHLHAYADIETAYVCRGYVWDSCPYSAQYASGEIDFGAFGSFDAYVWTMSSMTSKGHSTPTRNAYNEIDYGLRYAFDLELCKDWTLTSGAIRQWVTNPGVRHGGHSLIDWQAFQALKNPYLTPYWKLRYIRRPYQAAYWCAGVKRGFALLDDLVFTVDLFGDFGDARHFRHLFGPKPDNPDSNYHGGIHALTLMLRLDYRLAEHFTLYGFVAQYSLVSKDARDAVGASSAEEAKRDLTYGGVGLQFDF